MKIAVIVPYYPEEETAELYTRCLDSIDIRFRVFNIVDYTHSGVSAARNRGIRAALNGGVDYITFLDADDTFNRDAFDQVKEAIEEAPDADIIQLNHEREKEGFQKWMKHFNEEGWYGLDNLPRFWVAVWNKIYKADLIRKHKIEFVEGRNYGEDEVFNLECLAKARKIYCSERVAMTHHFDNPNSLTKKVNLEGLLAEQHELLGFMYNHKDDPELYEAVRQRQVQLWSSIVYKTIKEKEDDESR